MRILFATHNQHKLREIQEILSNFPGTILCAKDLGMDQEVEENGTSFLENAEIKARALYNFAKAQGLLEEDDLVMADDSGLSIEALSFGPGIYSARFLGVDTPYPEKNRRILAMMEESSSKSRMAYFTCAIVAIFADGKVLQTEARCTGEIAKEPGGEEGFGYDPIFYLPEYRKTTAELSREEKNKVSHRGKALRKMERMIQEEQEKRDSARFSKAGQEQSGKGKEVKSEHKAGKKRRMPKRDRNRIKKQRLRQPADSILLRRKRFWSFPITIESWTMWKRFFACIRIFPCAFIWGIRREKERYRLFCLRAVSPIFYRETMTFFPICPRMWKFVSVKSVAF